MNYYFFNCNVRHVSLFSNFVDICIFFKCSICEKRSSIPKTFRLYLIYWFNLDFFVVQILLAKMIRLDGYYHSVLNGTF